MSGLSHFDEHGKAYMVDVTEKNETVREATEAGKIRVNEEVYRAIEQGTVGKGDVLGGAGKTGFAAQTTAHIGLSVFDVPVSPYPLWENALEMIKP